MRTHGLDVTFEREFAAARDAAELPFFSFIEQIRPGAGVVLDRMAVGCAPES